MIDPQNEMLVSMTEAARLLPGRPHASTLWRWRKKGINGVRLDTIKCGGKRLTSREAIARFVEESTAAADRPEPSGTASGTVRDHRSKARRRDRVERELAAYGL